MLFAYDIVRVNVVQTSVVQKMDSTIQRVSMRKINCAIQWIEIYPMDSVKLIHLFKQLDLVNKDLVLLTELI